MSLKDQVEQKRREIRTDGYAMSIGEWISLYEKNEIDIHPEFQRFFRWSNAQKSNLIESILLGIPLPPIFVSQRDDGIWDVVDGLQRLSTIYQFLGLLKDENNQLLAPLKLEKTKYLPDLENIEWNTESENPLPEELRLIIKRSKISVSIILKESDEHAKYDLFQRLNTGGSSLSDQEVRNCILVMLNKEFFLWIKKLSEYPPFQECISLSDRPISESYDIELVLRFIIFSLLETEHLSNIGDLGIFLTENMSQIASDSNFDKDLHENLFRNTFDKLSNSLGSSVFKRYDHAKDKFAGGFLVSPFEAVALGLAYNIHNNTAINDTSIETQIKNIWNDTEYTNWIGAGMTATRRIPKVIPLGRRFFSNEN